MSLPENLAFDDPVKTFLDVAGNSGDVIIIADWKRTILFVNPATCEKTGYKKKELIGKKTAILYREENQSSYTSKIAKNLRERHQWNGELELKKKNGSTVTMDMTIILYCDRTGKPAGSVRIGRDLTATRLLSQCLKERKDQLWRIMESMEDAVYVCDLEGKILFCNNAHCTMLGFGKEEIVGSRPPYPWIDPPAFDVSRVAFRRLRKEGRLKNLPLTWRRRDQSRLTVSITAAPLIGASHRIEGYVATARDITDVRYAEDLRKVREQNERLLNDLKYKAVRLSTLEKTTSLVLQNAGPSKIFSEITSGLKKLVHHDLAGVYVRDADCQCLTAHTLSKQTPFSRKLAKFPLPLGEGIIGAAAESGTMVWQNNAHLDPRAKYPPAMRPDKEHFIAVPLTGGKSIYGILVVARFRNPEFIEEEVLIVKSLAEAASVALENSRLVRELSVIRPGETSGHSPKKKWLS